MPLHSGEVLTTKDSLTRASSWVTSFPLAHDSLGVGERGFGQVITQLHQLTGSITPACDRHVQYLLTGANPSVLNRHMWGLQPWRCRLSIHPQLSQPTVLPFPPKDPTQSQVIHTILSKRSKKRTNLKSYEWEPPLDFYHNLSSKHSMS
jgi:hypothetical protein